MLDLIWYQHLCLNYMLFWKGFSEDLPYTFQSWFGQQNYQIRSRMAFVKTWNIHRVWMWSTLLSLFGHGFSLQTSTTALERSWHQKNSHACDGKAKGKGYYQWTRNNNPLAFRFKMKLDFAIVGAGLADSSQFPGTGVEARRTAWARWIEMRSNIKHKHTGLMTRLGNRSPVCGWRLVSILLCFIVWQVFFSLVSRIPMNLVSFMYDLTVYSGFRSSKYKVSSRNGINLQWYGVCINKLIQIIEI